MASHIKKTPYSPVVDGILVHLSRYTCTCIWKRRQRRLARAIDAEILEMVFKNVQLLSILWVHEIFLTNTRTHCSFYLYVYMFFLRCGYKREQGKEKRCYRWHTNNTSRLGCSLLFSHALAIVGCNSYFVIGFTLTNVQCTC